MGKKVSNLNLANPLGRTITFQMPAKSYSDRPVVSHLHRLPATLRERVEHSAFGSDSAESNPQWPELEFINTYELGKHYRGKNRFSLSRPG